MHIPERTCIVTRQKMPQNELIRLYKLDDKVYVQKKSKRVGRGVYVVPKLEVFDQAFKSKRNPVKYGLRLSGGLSEDEVVRLRKDFEEQVNKLKLT